MSELLTTLRDAQDRAIVVLPVDVRQVLLAADTTLRLHGLQFELVCEACHRRGGAGRATVGAEHGADGSLAELVCGCTRRRFGAAC